jgi:hypothetical protein
LVQFVAANALPKLVKVAVVFVALVIVTMAARV